MADYSDINLQALKERRPDLASRLKDWPLSANACGQERVIDSDDKFHQGLIWVFHGMGPHVKERIQAAGSASKSFVIIEPDMGRFRHWLSQLDFSRELRDTRAEWVIGQQLESLPILFRGYFRQIDKLCQSVAVKSASHLGAVERDGAYFAKAQKFFSEASGDALLSIIAKPEDNLRGLMNLLNNCRHLAGGHVLDGLQGRYAGFTGVVVSTGPSLNESLEALKRIRERCVVISADSALTVLLQNGIKPDFVACLERVAATARLFDGLPPLPDVPLIHLPLVYPKTLENYPGPMISVCSKGIDYSWFLGPRPHLRMGNSVATMAITCLKFLGCHRILLFGQDLAYKRGSAQSHALGASQFIQDHGSAKHDELAKREDSENWVLGNDGTPILSWEPYRIMARQIAHYTAEAGIECHNVIPRGYGMKIEGISQVEPDDIDTLELTASPKPRVSLDSCRSSLSLEDLSANLRAGRAQIEHLKGITLKVLYEIEAFYHDNLPTLMNEALEARYLAFLSQLEGLLNQIMIRDPAFRNILWTYFGSIHVREIGKYYRINAAESGFEKRIKPMLEALKSWFKEVYFWSSQIGQAMDASEMLGAPRPLKSHGPAL